MPREFVGTWLGLYMAGMKEHGSCQAYCTILKVDPLVLSMHNTLVLLVTSSDCCLECACATGYRNGLTPSMKDVIVNRPG